jgi:Rrf2 family protein
MGARYCRRRVPGQTGRARYSVRAGSGGCERFLLYSVTTEITIQHDMRTNCRFAMALHVLAVLAYKDGDHVSSAFLSESVNTNPVIIRRLLGRLQRAKLVETRKGPRAGSRLSRSAARINLAEVYLAVDGTELFTLPRHRPNARCPVGHEIQEALRPVFLAARGALESDLAGTTLATVMESIRHPAKRSKPVTSS